FLCVGSLSHDDINRGGAISDLQSPSSLSHSGNISSVTAAVNFDSSSSLHRPFAKYPHRLYEVEKPPIQNRSMNHSCYLANIQTVKEAV
ncbi:unnamed protein product, partial [Brassica rapa subsp. trilocularis]